MKSLFLAALMLPAPLFAQTQRRDTIFQTEHEHRGASHQSTHGTAQPSEHRSHAEWHYHRGPKRPQVPYDPLPVNGVGQAGGGGDSSGQHGRR